MPPWTFKGDSGMPVGIITDVGVTVLGGILGCLLGSKLSARWKALLNNLLGVAAMVMGIVLILRVVNLSAAVLALLAGACVGQALNLEQRVNAGANAVMGKLLGSSQADEGQLAQISAALVLFCCGGTGWFGALNEGLTGDGSILVTKAILDGVTACIFAALLGKIIPCLALPQLGVYLMLFFASGLVAPFITDTMIADFSAVGGIITLVAGMRLGGIKRDIPVLNLLPGLILAFFFSAAWTAFVA